MPLTSLSTGPCCESGRTDSFLRSLYDYASAYICCVKNVLTGRVVIRGFHLRRITEPCYIALLITSRRQRTTDYWSGQLSAADGGMATAAALNWFSNTILSPVRAVPISMSVACTDGIADSNSARAARSFVFCILFYLHLITARILAFMEAYFIFLFSIALFSLPFFIPSF